MKKLKFCIAFLLAIICSFQHVCAIDFKKPVLDIQFDTLVVGKSYLLYNAATGKFITDNGNANNYVCLAGSHIDSIASDYNGNLFSFTNNNGSTYIQNGNLYMYKLSNNVVGLRSSKHSWKVKSVDKELKHYTISYYADSCYIGFSAGDTLTYAFKSTDKQIVWKLLPYNSVARYYELVYFYNTLTGTTEFQQSYIQPYIDKYYEYYNDPNSISSDIRSTHRELLKELDRQNIAGGNVPLWISGDGSYYYSDNSSAWYNGDVYTSSSTAVNINAHFTVDETSYISLCLEVSNNTYLQNINIYDNDILIRNVYPEQLSFNSYSGSYSLLLNSVMSEGNHKVTVEFIPKKGYSCGCGLVYANVYTAPEISVSLLGPGSLGTEALYYVDHLKDVRNLKIKGEMNSDDWAKIDMMYNLVILDLSEANITEIPAGQFQDSHIAKIILSNTLRTIGEKAFYESRINELIIPETIESIGAYAFENSLLRNVYLPDVKDIGEYAFRYCYGLENVNLGDSLTVVADYLFYECSRLRDIYFGQSMDEIRPRAFYKCSSLESVNGGIHLPNSLRKIQGSAFYDCSKLNLRFNEGIKVIWADALSGTAIDSLIIPETATSLVLCQEIYSTTGSLYSLKGFANDMDELVYVELPSSFWKTTYNNVTSNSGSVNFLKNCPNVNTLVLKSPTVVDGEGREHILYGSSKSNITLRVPDYLVSAYKLDEIWYNYKIEGFSTENVKYWEINRNLTLYAKGRFRGNPNMKINAGLKILGEEGMDIDTLTIVNGSRFISSNDDVKINGELYLDYATIKNKWYFISLPFNIKVSEIVPGNNAKYAIRYYDGANRAINGAKGNWKNFSTTDTIKAGTGFIYQTSVDGTTRFVPMDEESKQNIVSNEIFVKALSGNPSEVKSHSGWNFIGNPWQAYFNNHVLNFTAPITVWNGSTYTAYSIIDDDYAIRPNEAFFVQCPEGTEYISFPETGRQLTSEITNQSSAPAKRTAAMGGRQLVDVAISAGDLTDKTRVVLNDAALMEYETACDASKFFTMDAGVPQIYTLDSEATEYSINERPVADGNVQLGLMLATSGRHTISMPRNDAKTVVLIDHVAGTTHDLSLGEYTFTADAGTYDGRFTLSISKAPTTAIDEVGAEVATVKCSGNTIYVDGVEGNVAVFSVDGRKVAEAESKGSVAFDNLTVGSYLVRTVNGTSKVTVK